MTAVTICVRCGRENSRTASVCSGCGARLPRLDLASPEIQIPVGDLTERFEQFKHATDKVRSQEWSPEEFARFLDDVQDTLRRRNKVFVYSETGEAEEVQPDQVDHFEHYHRGLEVMWGFLDDGDLAHLDRGLQIMQEGNDTLMRGSTSSVPVEMMETESAVAICVLCGTENAGGTSVCSQCGARLPRVELSGGGTTKLQKVTERYDRFKQATDRVTSGEWSLNEFANFLEEVQELLRQKSQVYFTVLNESGYAEYAGEEVEMGSGGIEDYEKGMEELWNYVETGDASHLNRGLDLMWEGNEKLNKAMTMNRSLRKELTEQFGYI